MKDQRKTEIKVGVTVITGIIIILFVFGWAKNLTVNSGKKEIQIEYTSVAGLEVGDPVAVNGVRKGYVDEIKIQDTKVNVLVNLDRDIVLKKDADFFIMMLDLMGGKKVEINPGSSVEELDYTQIQKGECLGDIASAMAAFGSVEKDLVDVIKEVKETLTYLNQNLADPRFNEDLRASLSNLTMLTKNLNNLITNNKDEINKLLQNSIDLTRSVNNFFVNNQDSLQYTITSLKQTLDHSKKLIININDFINKTNQSANNLGRFLNDESIMNDITTSIQQLKELTKLLIEQLKNEGIKVDANIDLF